MQVVNDQPPDLSQATLVMYVKGDKLRLYGTVTPWSNISFEQSSWSQLPVACLQEILLRLKIRQ